MEYLFKPMQLLQKCRRCFLMVCFYGGNPSELQPWCVVPHWRSSSALVTHSPVSGSFGRLFVLWRFLLTNRVSGRRSAPVSTTERPALHPRNPRLCGGKSEILTGRLLPNLARRTCMCSALEIKTGLRHIIWSRSTLWRPPSLAGHGGNDRLADQTLTWVWLSSALW